MERDLRVRLSCARVALEGLSGDTRVGVSATQSRVISDLVSRDPSLHSVSLESLTALQELATRVAWEASDKERVLKCLTPKRVLPKDTDSGVARRPMQHFAPASLSYFTNTEWLHLRHGAGTDSKVDLVMQRVSQLTGFNLTENTLKLLASRSVTLHWMMFLGQWMDWDEEAVVPPPPPNPKFLKEKAERKVRHGRQTQKMGNFLCHF